MTGLEINKAVAEKLGVKVYERSAGMLFTATKHRGDYTFTRFDPCNNIEQAWEIMTKYNICVTRVDDDSYDAVHNLEFVCQGKWQVDLCVTDKKPLVAAMLCFLGL